MYANEAKYLNREPLYQSGYRTKGNQWHKVWGCLSMHGDTMYFLSNRIEDMVGDAPQESFTC